MHECHPAGSMSKWYAISEKAGDTSRDYISLDDQPAAIMRDFVHAADVIKIPISWPLRYRSAIGDYRKPGRYQWRGAMRRSGHFTLAFASHMRIIWATEDKWDAVDVMPP